MFDKHTQSAQFSDLDSGTHPDLTAGQTVTASGLHTSLFSPPGDHWCFLVLKPNLYFPELQKVHTV